MHSSVFHIFHSQQVLFTKNFTTIQMSRTLNLLKKEISNKSFEGSVKTVSL
jgi:hypothetical protein